MATIFEVRVEGELAPPTLRRLGWPHCVAEQQSLIRIKATPEDLHRLLRACSDTGLTIEGVVRADP